MGSLLEEYRFAMERKDFDRASSLCKFFIDVAKAQPQCPITVKDAEEWLASVKKAKRNTQ